MERKTTLKKHLFCISNLMNTLLANQISTQTNKIALIRPQKMNNHYYYKLMKKT